MDSDAARLYTIGRWNSGRRDHVLVGHTSLAFIVIIVSLTCRRSVEAQRRAAAKSDEYHETRNRSSPADA